MAQVQNVCQRWHSRKGEQWEGQKASERGRQSSPLTSPGGTPLSCMPCIAGIALCPLPDVVSCVLSG